MIDATADADTSGRLSTVVIAAKQSGAVGSAPSPVTSRRSAGRDSCCSSAQTPLIVDARARASHGLLSSRCATSMPRNVASCSA